MNIHRYVLLIYQVPSQPSGARVGVWRELKENGCSLSAAKCLYSA